MEEINGKKLIGYVYADGVHWHWGKTEVAVIDQKTGEIEWCDRLFKFPKEVVDAIRQKKPKAANTWVIEAKRISMSTTQGAISIQIDGKEIASFNDDKQLGDKGFYESSIPDEELGKCVCAALWHPHDNVYHISDNAKKIFYHNYFVEKKAEDK